MVELAAAEEAEQHRLLGSPSVRVGGRDVEPGADERESFIFACRIYRTCTASAASLPRSGCALRFVRKAAEG